MGTFLFMTDDHSDVSFSGVTLANSPGLFFIFCCRPTKLDDFVGFIQDSHPWSPRMLVDMAFEDIPSLVINSVDMCAGGCFAAATPRAMPNHQRPRGGWKMESQPWIPSWELLKLEVDVLWCLYSQFIAWMYGYAHECQDEYSYPWFQPLCSWEVLEDGPLSSWPVHWRNISSQYLHSCRND